MNVTATELKNQLGFILNVASEEDVFISKNGKLIAKLTSPSKSRVDSAKKLFGAIPSDFDIEEAFAQRGQK